MKIALGRTSAEEATAISNMIDAVQGTRPPKPGPALHVVRTPAAAQTPEPMPKPSSVAAAPVTTGGTVVSLADAVAGLDALMARAAQLAGTDLAGFKKLKKSDQNAFVAQARGEQNTGTQSDREKLDVHPRQLVRSPWNRSEFDPEEMKEMRESVREHGILAPLLVRPWEPKTVEDKERAFNAYQAGERMFEIVAGERRWTAATLENLERVPVIVRTLSDEEAIELQAIENLQREDLNPLDEAQKYHQLRELYTGRGMKNEEAIARICERLSKSRAHVFDTLRLLNLPDTARSLMRSGELPKSHAGIVAKVKDPERAALVAKAIVYNDNGGKRSEPLPFREAKQLVEKETIRQRNLVAYEDKRAQFEKDGLRILSAEDSAKIVKLRPHDNSAYLDSQAPYIQPGDYCQVRGANWRTFAQLWPKKKTPPAVLAMAPDGRPVEIYTKAEADELAKAGGKLKEADEAAGTSLSAAELERQKAATQRAETFAAVLPMIVDKAEKSDGSADVWRWLAAALTACSWNDVCRKIVRRRKLSKEQRPEDAIAEAVATMTGAEARALIVEAVLLRFEPSPHSSDYPEKFAKACEVFGIDLQTVAQSVQTSGQTKKGKGKA